MDKIPNKLVPYLEQAKLAGLQAIDEINLPEFTIEDLVGKILADAKTIKNPLPYSKSTGPNPKELLIETYSDGSYIVNMYVGYQDYSILHNFLVEGETIRYTDCLRRVF